MTDAQAERLAKRIARDLFTNGSKQRAKRLKLELPGGGDGGGWAEPYMADRIKILLLSGAP